MIPVIVKLCESPQQSWGFVRPQGRAINTVKVRIRESQKSL